MLTSQMGTVAPNGDVPLADDMIAHAASVWARLKNTVWTSGIPGGLHSLHIDLSDF